MLASSNLITGSIDKVLLAHLLQLASSFECYTNVEKNNRKILNDDFLSDFVLNAVL
jgi:hypothetical protein